MELLLACAFVSGFMQLTKGEGGCKVLEFLDCVKNKTFTGHVTKSLRVLAPGLASCQHQCHMSDDCVSYNLGPVQGQIQTCELSDADHLSIPSDLVPKEGFEYCAIKSPCSLKPCPSGKVCIPDFSWDTASCRDGHWTQWSNWTVCGDCPSSRTRSCKNPYTQAPATDCVGKNLEKKECKAVPITYDCAKPLGMENGDITDAQITASSSYPDSWCKPEKGRLNAVSAYAWCAGPPPKPDQYLQVDLLSTKTITKIATQGRANTNQWVTEYTLAYRLDAGSPWIDYSGDQSCTIKKFVGNTDRTSIVMHELPVAIRAQYIRLKVQKWRSYASIRVEFYGC